MWIMWEKSCINKYIFTIFTILIISINIIMSINFTNIFDLTASTSNVTAYPQNRLNRSTYYHTLFDTTILPYNKQYNNCSNTLCYTSSKGTFIYQPHTAYGMVGTTAAAYLARRRRL
jgi:hypothetical protein